MKPVYYKKYEKQAENSFLVKYAEVPHTVNKFHFHHEYELLFNIENSGTRFIGDSIHRFDSGDLVLVGPHLPHYWHSDDKYFRDDPNLKAKVVLIQFVEHFLGREFLQLSEIKPIKDLLVRAKQGVQIKGKEAQKIGEKIQQLVELDGWQRLMSFIEILCMMGEAPNFRLLASSGFCEAHKIGSEEKISQIFNFMISNYNKELTLTEIADHANMNTSAFCRYLKKSTTKTFSEILNEIRIGFACKKLISSDNSISEIAYTCGYQNVPYFNRQFKKIKELSPQAYKQKYKTR